jgi:hypothetical protein
MKKRQAKKPPIIHEPSEVNQKEKTCRAPSATAASNKEKKSRTPKREKKAAPAKEKKQPWAAPFAETFKKAYSAQPKTGWYCYGVPYGDSRADYVQLASLVKRLGDIITPEDWRLALINYFRTPQGKHTLADLASRYDTFRLYPLDNFGKPRPANGLSKRGQESAAAIQDWINDPATDALVESILGPNTRLERDPKGLLK